MPRVRSRQFPNYLDAKPGNVGIAHVSDIKRFDRTVAAPFLEPHVHGPRQMEILYLARGRQTYRVEGRFYAMSGGDVLAIRPGETHSSGAMPEEKGLLYWVILDLPSARDPFLGLPAPQARRLLAAVRSVEPRLFRGSPALRKHLDAALHGLLDYGGDLVDSAAIQSHVVLFLAGMLACASAHPRPPQDPWRDTALAFLDRHMDGSPTAADMAAHMGLSRAQFSARFRAATGIPPRQYFLRQKVLRAGEEMIRHPERRIIDIGADLGFSSSQYFATVFRRYAGMSPRRFRLARRHAETRAAGPGDSIS
jgi:AraC-like DNA-binding protein